jgi:hypothetical protein
LVGFFPTNHISSPLSKNINFMYQKSMDQNGIFGLVLFKFKCGPKLTFWIRHFCSLWPIGIHLRGYLKHVWGPNSARLHTSMYTCSKLAIWQNLFI